MVLRSRREGFTLVELMVVVAIIGISVLAFAPSISRAFAEREVSFTTREVLRLAKRARSEALGYRRAYLLWVQPGTADTMAPIVQLIRASTSSCVAQPWTTMQAPTSSASLELIDFNGNETFGTRGFNVRMVEEKFDGSTSIMNRAICWAPDGTVYTTAIGALETGSLTTANAADDSLRGAVVFRFSLFQNGVEVGTPHRLMIPLGGSPMVVP